MSFSFHPSDRDLTRSVRRIAGAELAAALTHLAEGAPGAAGVHDVRKRIKKLRGLLRLVRSGMHDARAEITVLRDAARGLSGLRDAEVMLGWHDRLAPGLQGPLRDWLAGRIEAERADEGLPGRVADARSALLGVAGRAQGWRIKGRDTAVLAKGLERTLARGAADLTLARDTRDVEPLHDWRKRVKDLWYQTRLLSPIWPAGMAVWQQAADDLGEMLGDHHDLAVFMALIEDVDGTEVPGLRAQALRMSADLESRALELGARIYAATPQAIAGLWLAWWKVWKAGR